MCLRAIQIMQAIDQALKITLVLGKKKKKKKKKKTGFLTPNKILRKT